MRDLKFIQACPDDDYYLWQVHLWLESLKNLNKSKDAVSLIFTPSVREFNKKWYELQKLYPEAEFKFYKDTDNVTKLIPIYIPILRPYVLMKYFRENPKLKDTAIFYCDADVLFTNNFNIDSYLEDDVCYVSNTLSYINASYFDSKIKDVLPDKIEDYKKRDILSETCKLVGISREIAENNNLHSGGAQYLLKNIDYKFWEKVISDCIKIRFHLQEVNKEFFQNENKGFQSWCSDMWAVLWNLWFLNKEVRIISEMDFVWSSDPISKLDKIGIFHNAGIVSKKQGDVSVFYKGEYHKNRNPFLDPYLEEVSKDESNKKLANSYYVAKMMELKNKYDLTYLN